MKTHVSAAPDAPPPSLVDFKHNSLTELPADSTKIAASTAYLQLEQYRFGKLVRWPQGPICSGAEHRCTGRSRGFPIELAPLCHPTKLGNGERDAGLIRRCTWPQGGFATRSAVTDGHAWVIAVRQIERSEGGLGSNQRAYTEAQYASQRAAEFTPFFLPALANALKAESLCARDMELAPLNLPLQDHAELSCQPPPLVRVGDGSAGSALATNVELDPKVWQMLDALLAGEPVTVEDADANPALFLERYVVPCLALLPAAVSWRMSVGVGLYTSDGSHAIALCMRKHFASEPPRPPKAPALRKPKEESRAYVAWLQDLLPAAKSHVELRAAVEAALPDLNRHDAMPLDWDWRICMEALEERGRKQWVRRQRFPQGARSVDTPPLQALYAFAQTPAAQQQQTLAQVESWLAQAPCQAPQDPLQQALLILYGHTTGTPELDQNQRTQLIALTKQLPPRERLATLRCEDLLYVAVHNQKDQPAPELSPMQLGCILEAIARNPHTRAQWQDLLQEQKWTECPTWRLIAGMEDGSSVCGQALLSLSSLAAIRLLLAGWPIPPKALMNLRLRELWAAGEAEALPPIGQLDDPEDALRIATVNRVWARTQELPAKLRHETAVWALRCAHANGLGEEEVKRLARKARRRGLHGLVASIVRSMKRRVPIIVPALSTAAEAQRQDALRDLIGLTCEQVDTSAHHLVRQAGL